MARVVFKKMCPKCSGLRLRRVEREPWMRRLPKSKYYRCDQCRSGMIVLFDCMTWRVN